MAAIENNSTNANKQPQAYKKPGAGTVIGGVLAGSAVGGLTNIVGQSASKQIIKKFVAESQNITKDEITFIDSAAKEVLNKTGLANRGVKIIEANEKNANEIVTIMTKEFDNSIITKYMPKDIKKIFAKAIYSTVKLGQNAFYTFKSKKIIKPENGLTFAIFHEMGHAANQNLSTTGKILQKIRAFSLLAIPISLIALWKNKKAPNQPAKNNTDKATTFIKENAGKLTFAAFVPMLLEEGLASIKGNNFAKKILSPELAKKVSKTNLLGFSSYLTIAVASSLAVFAGTKVKDSIAKTKPIGKN